MEGEQAPEENDRVSFEEFIQLMQQVENKLAKDEPSQSNKF